MHNQIASCEHFYSGRDLIKGNRKSFLSTLFHCSFLELIGVSPCIKFLVLLVLQLRMDTVEKLKTILPLVLFSIVFATIDNVTDLILISRLFNGVGLVYSSIAISAPFMINYILCFINWFCLEEDKPRTFIFPLFNVYLQFSKS